MSKRGSVLSSHDVQFEGGIRIEIGVEQVKSGVVQLQHGVDRGFGEVTRGVDEINRVRTFYLLQAVG